MAFPRPVSGSGLDQLTGDVTAGPGTGSQAATLAAVGTAGTYGSATAVPEITIDAKGRVTGVTTVAPAPSLYATFIPDFFSSTLPANVGWHSVAYGNGVLVAVATGSTDAAYSTNGGQTWTLATLPASVNWQSVAYGNGVFVAVAYSSTYAAYTPLSLNG